jgi:hypothetical protein
VALEPRSLDINHETESISLAIRVTSLIGPVEQAMLSRVFLLSDIWLRLCLPKKARDFFRASVSRDNLFFPLTANGARP